MFAGVHVQQLLHISLWIHICRGEDVQDVSLVLIIRVAHSQYLKHLILPLGETEHQIIEVGLLNDKASLFTSLLNNAKLA